MVPARWGISLSMSDELPPELMAKWLADRLGPDDQRILAEWLAADPARADELEELREIWRRAGALAETQAAATDPSEEVRWMGVLAQIQANKPIRTINFPHVSQRSRV